jgi:anti-sigma B factor antagonist
MSVPRDSGPIEVLSGESDVSAAAELTAAPTMHIAADARHPTVDLSRLRFADSASIQAFVRADRVLKADGGAMELVAPQPAVAQVLSLLSADQFIAVRPAPAPGALEGASAETDETSRSRQVDAGSQSASG